MSLGYAYPTAWSAQFRGGSPVIDIYGNNAGETLVAVKTGPAAHQVSHFNRSCVIVTEKPLTDYEAMMRAGAA